MPPTWELVLEHRDDEGGQWRRTLALQADGGLVLAGHDHGPGVSEVFGPTVDEYEFVRTIAAAGVAELRRVLSVDGDDELRTTLEEQFCRPGGSHAFERFLTEHEVPSEFWNRIGS